MLHLDLLVCSLLWQYVIDKITEFGCGGFDQENKHINKYSTFCLKNA